MKQAIQYVAVLCVRAGAEMHVCQVVADDLEFERRVRINFGVFKIRIVR